MKPEVYLKSLVDYEKQPTYDYDLDEFIRFLERLDSPHCKLRNVIHIGGTKGKGACAELLASCLTRCGYKVGLYTSPHLAVLNERIKVNNTLITNSELSYYIGRIKKLKRKKRDSGGARTFFETITAIAFLHFVRNSTDFTILEVGLGGRLDATNSIDPLITIITRIGYDHTALLGHTLSLIAQEKAGIIKKHGNLYTIQQRPRVQKILEKYCRLRSCSLHMAGQEHEIKVIKQTIKGSTLSVTGRLGKLKIFLPLPGVHQIENLSIVLAVLNELRNMNFNVTASGVKNGIRQTKLRGRFELISKNPPVIFDCAHNQDSFKALYFNIKELKIRNFSLVFGSSAGKDLSYALKNIFPEAKEVVLVKARNPRAILPVEINMRARKYQKNMIIAPSVAQALDYLKNKSKKDSIIITGSFYLWQKNW